MSRRRSAGGLRVKGHRQRDRQGRPFPSEWGRPPGAGDVSVWTLADLEAIARRR
jgi:hypothetical protein